jgi:hypothetical protein
MARRRPTWITAAALAAAAAAGAWWLLRADAVRPAPAEMPVAAGVTPPAGGPPAPSPSPPTPITGEPGARESVGTAAPPRAAEAAGDAAAAEELSRRMQKLVSDLEYSPGRREPPQQLREPQPEPWRPAPGATAGPAPIIEQVTPRTAPPGTRVRIRGRHLRAAQVMFGALPAEVEGDSDTELVVLVPEGGEGEVPVAVTNLDGGYAVAEAAFVFEARPGGAQ